MRKLPLALALAAAATAAHAVTPVREVASYVDPQIGTGGHGHTFPGPSLPFGMVQLSPDTRLTGWDGCSGYHDSDTFVYGFSHTHLSGTGISDYGDVLLLPATGAPKLTGYGSRFRKETEKAEAGSYRVALEDSGVGVELTTTLRTGWHRYTFPKSDSASLLLDLQHRDTVLESSLRLVDDHTIEGMRRSKAWARDQVVYFVATFSKPFDAVLAVDDALRPELREANGTNLKAVLRYTTTAGERILAKVAISAIDLEGARKNLAAEGGGWDFEATRAAARAAWNRELGVIQVEGGTDAQRVIFYTALYHAFLQPNVFQDVDGRYRGVDHKIHEAKGYTRHTVFSLWDTFRGAHPLYTILQRRRSVDFIRTFLDMYREGGRLPVWELAGNETDTMIGYHAVSVIVDAWMKGIRDFDPGLALDAMKASADADRYGLAAYKANGYIPVDAEAENVSKTVEYAYDDWTIGRFAEALGKKDDARRFFRRAAGWQNLLDPAGYMHPRADGRWVTPFDPAEVTFNFTEANAWQYSFFVPHDVAGLMQRLGGPKAFEAHLDALFAAEPRTKGRQQSDITGLVGQYAHGNEPSHHMAYLYAFAGAPQKTQALVHRLIEEMYAPRPDGLIGNEDCGQMSAWLVLSALGFYSVTPGQPEYVIGTPLFDSATITLENGKSFVIRARRATPGAFYVQSVQLNGRPHTRAVLLHDAILSGGELVFDLGSSPSSWATSEADRPHSAVNAAAITPAPTAEAPILVGGEAVSMTLAAAAPGDVIHYTLDDHVPDENAPVYSQPLTVHAPATVNFRARRGGVWSSVVHAPVRRLDPNRRVTLRCTPSKQYTAGGDQALLDGQHGDLDFRRGRWQGFQGQELDADVDLGGVQEIHKLAIGFLQDQASWIFLPHEVKYSVSEDGTSWRSVGAIANDVDPRAPPVRRDFVLTLPPTRARYVRVQTRSFVTCPPWHPGNPNGAYVFTDEIEIE
jgi:predicted alpha-1,2-mannosidase